MKTALITSRRLRWWRKWKTRRVWNSPTPSVLCGFKSRSPQSFHRRLRFTGTAEMPSAADCVFREPLPECCPPPHAREVSSPLTVFRLIASSPPRDDDFRSQRAENPVGIFKFDECDARGVSVFTDAVSAANAKRFPRLRHKIVCCVKLGVGAGYITPPSARRHCTWWPFKAYDILVGCEVPQ